MSSELIIVDLVKKGKESIIFLLGKWKTLFLVAVITGLIGIVKTWLQDPKYTAQMTFVAENEKGGGLGGYASIAAQFGLDIGGGGSGSAFAEENLVELLKSRMLIDKTLLSTYNNNLFIEQYITNHRINKNWSKDTALSKINFQSKLDGGYERKRDSIFNSIANNIILNEIAVDKVDKKLDIIYIKMSDLDMIYAKRFIEKLASNAIAFYTSYKTEKNQTNVNILQRQTDSVKAMLFGSINDVASINDLNVNPIKQSLRTNGQKRQIDLQVNSALYTELLKNLELAKLTLRKETPLIQIIDTPKLPLKNEKKGRLFMGVIFGFLGSFLCALFLLIKKWVAESV